MNTIVPMTRRGILQQTAAGFGWLALSAMLADQVKAAAFDSPLAPRSPHFTPKAKRVIFLFMQGAPSHVDTFDWKPELKAKSGKTFAAPGDEKARPGTLLAPQFEFTPHGQSGLPISSLFPELAKHADDLCLLNGMHTSNAAHPQASIALHTGSAEFRATVLGIVGCLRHLAARANNCPGSSRSIRPQNVGGAQNDGSSFCLRRFKGRESISIRAGSPTSATSTSVLPGQRAQIDLIQEMNRDLLATNPGHRELDGVIQSFEMAYQMQSSVPEVFDLSGESEAIRERYGIGQSATNSFGTQCLAARRLAESGVRFIQVSMGGWDQHQNLKSGLSKNCGATDKPIAALLQDLKERSMLEDTLVVWGEFGRSPQDQGKDGDGRRHNNRGYTMWMAGGGVKGGLRYGSTDEVGDTAVEGKIGTHDLHATILHLLGIDHTKLTYRYSGRDFRLTDVYGEVVRDIMI